MEQLRDGTPRLEVEGVSKRFGAFSAVNDVNLIVYPGEVLGVAGQSGSGKSALSMLLAGLYTPSEGRITFEGEPLKHSLASSRITLIQQEPDLADCLDVTANIFLGHEIGWSLFFEGFKIPNRRRMDKESARILQDLEVEVPSLREKVSNLSAEQRQMIAIARALVRPTDLIVIDEPTLSLSYPYQKRLLQLIQRWQAAGRSIVFTSDNLDHLLAVTDRIAVLRYGRIVAQHRTAAVDREDIVGEMVGTTDQQELTPIIWALDRYYSARDQAKKLRNQQVLLERDLAKQDTLNQQLIDQLAEQIQALDSINVSLQDAQRRLLTEREQERKRLARDLHDQVIQDLLIVNYQLEEVETLERVAPELQKHVQQTRQVVRNLVEDLRNICGDLRPPTIDSLGLMAALESLAHEWIERTGIPVALDFEEDLGRLPETLELSIFRIVQEGLSNIYKHAGATRASVRLTSTSPRALMLSIADDGRGLEEDFDLSQLSSAGHYGLLGISERVALLGGRLKLQNQTQGGLLLQVEIPHPRLD